MHQRPWTPRPQALSYPAEETWVPTTIFQAFPLTSRLYYGDPKARGHLLSLNVMYVQFPRILNVHTVKMSLNWGAQVLMTIMLYKKMPYVRVGDECETEWDDTVLCKVSQCDRTSCTVILPFVSQLQSICKVTTRQCTYLLLTGGTRTLATLQYHVSFDNPVKY